MTVYSLIVILEQSVLRKRVAAMLGHNQVIEDPDVQQAETGG